MCACSQHVRHARALEIFCFSRFCNANAFVSFSVNRNWIASSVLRVEKELFSCFGTLNLLYKKSGCFVNYQRNPIWVDGLLCCDFCSGLPEIFRQHFAFTGYLLKIWHAGVFGCTLAALWYFGRFL